MTLEMNAPTPEAFAAMYREGIRVGLNWDRFLAERWPVELVIIDNRAALERFFMPWYIGVKGDEVAYDAPGAVPLRLTDVPKSMHILNLERQTDILDYVEMFRHQPRVIEFAVPTYALPDDQYFVLDGNHRLSALSINPAAFSVTLWNVCGPFDMDGLLDLRHWLQKKDDD